MFSQLFNQKNIVQPSGLPAQCLVFSETLDELNKGHLFEERATHLLNLNLTEMSLTNQNTRNAMWYYLRAALRGDKEAQYKMGLSYLNGQLGLDRSYLNAQKWLEQAAQQGHKEAKFELQNALNRLAFS